jgi:hypothetical protein
MRNLVFIFAIAATLFTSTGSDAQAQWDVGRFQPRPILDVDYQVWALNPNPLWVWDVVVVGEDGRQVVSSGHATEREANYRLFRMINWGLIDFSAEVEVVRRNAREFQLLATYNHRADANFLADIFRDIGWEAEVVPIVVIDRR